MDDGSCIYPPIPGCTDPAATNYNPAATVDDGSCTYPPIPGCTDPAATNYDPAATVDDGSCIYPPPVSRQVTPDYTAAGPYMSASSAVNHQSTLYPNHDPDGIGWIDWTGTAWDGNPIDPSSMTPAQMCAFLRPTGSPYVIRGVREKFYAVNPFADNSNPTVEEINNWNVEVINHIRAMMGFTVLVKNDPRLYLEARWADERKFTQYWDTPQYPGGTPGTAPGPCHDGGGNPVDIAGGHCGASFFPDPADRAPYISASPYLNDFVKYPELQNYTVRMSQAEGVKTVNSDLPWAIKVSSMMVGFICGEGTTGHAGSFLTREYMGVSWHVYHDGVHGTRGRFKWR